MTGNLRIYLSRIAVMLPLTFMIQVAAMASGGNTARVFTSGDKHHGSDEPDCSSCHTGDSQHLDLSYCRQCHADGVPGVGSQPDKANDGASARKVLPTPQGDAGLVGPMYYESSRFSEEPGEMVHVPKGPFLMGSDDRLADEGPQFTAVTGDYWIDRYEVTNHQYKKFIDATGHRSPSHFRNRIYPKGKADHPVTFVSWYDARDYCQWAGKRLPTETEWEKAARGGDGRTYPWGNAFSIDRANTPVRWAALKRQGDTTPVGAFPSGASPYGLEDMSGNVWEWTASWYKPHPGNKQPSENYGEIYKILKGGSWWDCSFYKCGISAPVYNRSFFNPHVRNSSFGFRCADQQNNRVAAPTKQDVSRGDL